jgi:hypothetical protein
MADPGGVSPMRTVTHLAAIIALAIGMAIMGAAGCTSTDAAAHSQAEATRAELAASRADAAATNAQKAADGATVASLKAEKAVEDANREITRVEHHLDQLIKNLPRHPRHHHKRHQPPKASAT